MQFNSVDFKVTDSVIQRTQNPKPLQLHDAAKDLLYSKCTGVIFLFYLLIGQIILLT